MKKLCQHCLIRPIHRPGQLCSTCYRSHEIRHRYVSSTPSWKAPGTLYPPLENYPDVGEPTFCVCGLPDGECPDCERQQRAALFQESQHHEF